MSAGSLGKRWPGAIQDDEHVQAVLRTLAQFVERNVFSISGPSGSANYPKRTGTDDAVNSISELCDLAALLKQRTGSQCCWRICVVGLTPRQRA